MIIIKNYCLCIGYCLYALMYYSYLINNALDAGLTKQKKKKKKEGVTKQKKKKKKEGGWNAKHRTVRHNPNTHLNLINYKWVMCGQACVCEYYHDTIPYIDIFLFCNIWNKKCF